MHDWRTCEERMVCRTCQQAGKPCQHDWHECGDAMAKWYDQRIKETAQWGRPKERKGGASH